MFEWKSIPRRLPMYIYPVVLVLIEYLLRSLSSLETKEFIGPTLAIAGASLILPLTIRKPLTIERLKRYPQKIVRQFETLQQNGLPVQYLPREEETFIQICWTGVFVTTLIWVWALYLAIMYPDQLWLGVPSNYFPGFINYVIGLALTEVHEVL